MFFLAINVKAQKRQSVSIDELDSIITATYNAVEKINAGDVDMLPVYDCTLNEAEFTIEFVKRSGAFNTINTLDGQLVEVYRKYNDLLASIPKLRVIIDQYVSYHDFWYYKKGLELLSKGDTTAANSYFDKSLLFNPFYIPSIYQKAVICLGKNNVAKAAYLVEDLQKVIYPEGANLNLINGLIELIRKRFIDYGNRLLLLQDYNGSLEVFLEADTFCQHYNKFDCSAFQHGISLSKYGLYHSYLKVANQALDANKLSIAETFILKAKEYAILNRKYIVDDKDVDKNIKKLSKFYLELAFSYKNNSQRMQSDYYFQKADGLCKLINDEDCSKLVANAEHSTFVAPAQTNIAYNQHKKKTSHHKIKTKHKQHQELASAVKHKKKKTATKKKDIETITVKESETNATVRNSYWKYIEEGDAYANENKLQQAIDNYVMARSLESTASFTPCKTLDSLIKQNVINIINNDLQTAGFLVWANELANADSIYEKSIRKQKQYHIENDEELNASLTQLKQKMNTKGCQNLQDKIDMNTAMAKNNIALRDYVRAGNLLEEVLNIAVQNKNCVLLTTNTVDAWQHIKPVIDYYRYKEDAKAAYAANDLKKFVESYHSADVLYLNSKLDTAKIPYTGIVDYLRFQNNKEASFYTTNYYATINDWDGCLLLLKLLKEEDYAANKTEDIQIKVAKAKALTDSHKTFKLDVNSMIEKYTGGDKWFKYFNKAYKAVY